MKIGSTTNLNWNYDKYIVLKGDYSTFDASKTISIDESSLTLSNKVLNNLFFGFSLYGTEYLGSQLMAGEGPKELIFGKFYLISLVKLYPLTNVLENSILYY